jgi:hypothetical protein
MGRNYSVKLILGAIIFFCGISNLKAQYINIPDANFATWLMNNGYAGCMVGNTLDTTCPAVLNTTSITCSGENISDLTGIQYFSNLNNLLCSSNQLTSLPTLPSQLFELLCYYNQLANLPALPNQLGHLWCFGNQLTSLPSLPNSLLDLQCQNNQLTSLPPIPGSLLNLNCSHNQLTILPDYTNSLESIQCAYNLLTGLPEFPDTALFGFLDCSNNPNLLCLPQLKIMDQLDFTGTGVTCLPNYGNVTTSNPPLNSLPLCGIFNPNGCSSFWNISGKTFFDSNINCQDDFSDVRLSNMHILLHKNGNLDQQIFTGSEGLFSFDMLDTGNYEVELDTTSLSFDVLCPANLHYTDSITTTDSLFYNNDFSLKCKPGFDVGAWSIEGVFIVGYQTTLNIQAGDIADFYGVHCATGISGSVSVNLNGPATYVSPAPGALTPDIIIGDTVITYNIADFGVVNLNTAFNMVVFTDTLAAIDTSLSVCISVSISPALGDINPSNNLLAQCFPILASFDPNKKEVYPFGDLDLTENKWLTYTIHFQNTGTAPAEHIYIE